MADMIEFLLGRKIYEWTYGTFAFQAPLGFIHIVAALAAMILAVTILYRRTTTGVTPRLKTILIVLKSTALAVLFLCLLQPTLTASSGSPRSGSVALLIDNSRSMTIRDMERSQSRGEAGAELIYGSGGLIDRLGERFAVSTFGFDRDVFPVSGHADLTFKGIRTDMAAGLAYVGDALKGRQPAALVLVSDGGDNGSGDPLKVAAILNNRSMPVYVIGVGADVPFKDIEINQVTTSGPVLEGGVCEVQVTVSSRGYAGHVSDLLIETGAGVVISKKITHGTGARAERYTFHLTPESEGARVYTARIPDREDEIIKENNQMTFLVDNQAKQVRILYVEGHPRNEYKFIRRAAASDEAVLLKTYLKTGPQKFLRQNIDSPTELSGGYPVGEEDLFAYDAVIFGDIPRSFFSDEQLALTREFVSRRGGGFLMIGGSTAFDEGFISTPVADLLPVTLVQEKDLAPDLRGGGRRGDHPTGQKYTLRLTAEGNRSALLSLDTDDTINRKLWREMPQLQGINVTGRSKPGATVLAVHPTLQLAGNPLPVLTYQRYGRGRTMAIATATTWRWQMLMPFEDASHEKLWRQILRWLTADTPARVELVPDRSRYSAGDTARITARVHDQRYRQIATASVWLKITDPDGMVRDLPMAADLAQAGEYTAEFGISKPGLYQLETAASAEANQAGFASASFIATGPLQEFRYGGLDSELLEKLALESGGKFYRHAAADQVVKDLLQRREIQTVSVRLDVWDMPAVFLFLVACYGLEWMLRRRKGMS